MPIASHTKALLRILITELRVNSETDIQPTYRVMTPDRILMAGLAQRPKSGDGGNRTRVRSRV